MINKLGRDSSLKWPELYDKLRAKGYSKEKAARISNSAWNKKQMGLATNTPTSARGILKAMCPELSDDWDTIFAQPSLVKKDDQKSGSSTSGSLTVLINDESQEDDVTQIKKEDLPNEVVEYIDTLEDHATQVEAENTELVEKNEALTASLATAQSSLTEAGVAKGDPLAEVLAKADPAVRAVLEKQAADLAAMGASIAKAADADVVRTMIAKAEKLPMISTDKNEVAELLKSAYSADPESAEKLYGLLVTANEQIAHGNIFKEFGNGGADVTVSASVDSQAQELMKSDPSLTIEMAISKVFETNPDLYTESLKEG